MLEFSCPVTFFIGRERGREIDPAQVNCEWFAVPYPGDTGGEKGTAATAMKVTCTSPSGSNGWTGRVTGSFFASEVFHHVAESPDAWSKADPGCLDYIGNSYRFDTIAVHRSLSVV